MGSGHQNRGFGHGRSVPDAWTVVIEADGQRVQDAAARLIAAARSGHPCDPVRDLIGSSDISAAYAVQRLVVSRSLADGAHVVGRKIGLTSSAVRVQLGVDRPDFGVLTDVMDASHLPEVPMERLLQPRVEAEIAFELRADLPDDWCAGAAGSEVPLDVVRDAIAFARPALEIVDSRIRNWDISFGDTVADNASSGMFVLGRDRVSIVDTCPVAVEMAMTSNGSQVSVGNGAACLGDPLAAVGWLARTARDLGSPLTAGQVVLSGALGPMHPVKPGDTIAAVLSGLGTVRCTFSREML